MPPIPYLVQDAKLDTQFHSDPECTQHVKFVSDSALNQRRIRKEEKWSRERELGRGSYGIVWLQRCIQGDTKGEVRAVKKVQKFQSGDYYGELEAITLFSHAKYEHCFVKSLGWYDDEDSIFITMEYLPDGDLQKYLRSPLPEREAQHIILQVLEGLQFMHDNGYTHRDLKPQNILVKCKGPDWWVKIADFGISKRVMEEHTALRTLVGTPTFAAPEVLGFFRPSDSPNESYTNAVDIWSLGVIAFFILSGETLFKDQRRLGQFFIGNLAFPSNILLLNKVSAQGCDFVKSMMAPDSKDRPRVKDCLQHPWFKEMYETQRELNISNLSSSRDYLDPEPSANWSTQGQILTYEPNKFIDMLSKEAPPISSKIAAPSNSTSSNIFAPSKSLDYIDPGQAMPTSRNIVAPSIHPYSEVVASSKTTSNKAVALPTPTSHESVAQSTQESAAHTKWKFLRKLEGHTNVIYSMAFSPDGKLIATGSRDCTARLWDSATGEKRQKLEGHSKGVHFVTFLSNGTQLASASYDSTIRIWDIATGTECNMLKAGGYALAISLNERLIASPSDDNTVKLWDLATGTIHRTLKGHTDYVRAVAFSPDGKLLASGSFDETVKLWDLATGTIHRTLKGHTDYVRAVAFSPDGKLLASGSDDKTVELWDLATGTIHHTLKGHTDYVHAVAFSPDGKLLASGSLDKTVELWDLATGTIHRTLKGHTDCVRAVAFSTDGKLLASGSWDRTVKLWDSITGTMLQTFRGHSGDILDVKFSPDGNMIVFRGQAMAEVWGLSTEQKTVHVTKKKTVPVTTEKTILFTRERTVPVKKKKTMSNYFKNLLT